ncbi:MAG: flagellar biosynthesis protein FlgK [Glaciihabitans sp.]|nr:flagellar biosynthesis protein FlgK [Glaciihabitans sp.]
MSTFSGINAAHSALVAARTALDVTGQNIANLKTEGYTRQRVELSSIAAPGRTGLFSSGVGSVAGQGVSVSGIARLGNEMLDAQVRATSSTAGYAYVRANELSALEKGLNEPGANGLSAQLTTFWSAWQELANNAGSDAAAAVVVEEGKALAAQIAQGYTAVSNQWDALRTDADGLAAQLNGAATQVAELNGLIKSALVSGGSVNELLDKRSTLTTAIATLAGGTVSSHSDGTVEVLVGGNPIVSGSTAYAVTVRGSTSLDTLTDASAPRLAWSNSPDRAVALDGGELAGTLSMLAPTANGAGGTLAETANSYNVLATTLATDLNTVHNAGYTAGGEKAGDFFSFTPGRAAALGLQVVGTEKLATRTLAGGLDGGVADTISLTRSPDKLWTKMVSALAVSTRGELQQSVLADIAASGASSAQVANASVDLDEENVNMLMSQTAYNGAARVLTAMDEMLDTLINRTGLVGR